MIIILAAWPATFCHDIFDLLMVLQTIISMSVDIVLVTGGCGCVGFHIVQTLLQASNWLYVISRNSTINRFIAAIYHAGDVTFIETIQIIIGEVQLSVNFHVTSPTALIITNAENFYYKAIVTDTENLLSCARSTPVC